MPESLMPPAATLIEAESPEAQIAEQAPRQTAFTVRAIPKVMWDKHGANISAFILQEIGRADAERSSYFNDVARWKVIYDAPMSLSTKRFPFANAANVTVPMVKEIVNTLASQVVQSTMTAHPRWILKDLSPEWKPFVHPLEQFLDQAAERELGYDEAMIPAIIECTKIGTSILETGYEVDITRSYRYSPSGEETYAARVIRRDGPKIRNVPLANFWIRFAETDIQDAPWVGKEVWMNEPQLRQKVAQGRFTKDAVDLVLKFREDENTDNEPLEAEEDLSNTRPIDPDRYRVFEIHLRWDVDDDPDGLMEDIVVYWHKETGTVLSATFAPYWHGRRPFKKLGYFPRPGRFYDEGLAEMLEQIQVAVSATQNRRSDNAMLANLKMIIKRRSVKGLMPGDPLYPGKIIEVNDINNDLREFKMSEIYPSTVNEELMLRGYAERLSGFNDAVAGAAQPVSRTTATAQLALLQEQARRLDLTIRSVRGVQQGVGRDAFDLYQQFGGLGKPLAWLGENGAPVERILGLPRAAVEVGMAIRVNVPTSTQNQQVRRESSLSMFNLLNQLYQQIIPMAGQILPPEQVTMVVREMVSGSRAFMQDVLESFEATNPDEVLSALTLLERLLPDARDLGGLEDFERTEAAAEVAAGLAGVEALLRSAAGASDRGPGLVGSGGGAPPAVPDAGATPGLDAGLFVGGESAGS